MPAHIIDGQFQSDKYPWCHPGFVPLKLTDPMAQPVLWEYARVRREVDAEFSDDLKLALVATGYCRPTEAAPDLLAACAPFDNPMDYRGVDDHVIVLKAYDRDGLHLTAGQVRAIKAAMAKAREGATSGT